ncbi:P-loop containing nucleoside triphosphate hydrolase protein [Fimicolochytrium jonesii]|uniref:P-loop containing nucleoside triphosphate hydrolase protein n=1 Tax=Fimicolochytrium jonesii TaxID=1396493 RepID=UPI0022FEF6D3|nr:P-loop containing nucleoside triphosphate hydrolase protein [Fimicolochytrium jonesii]KAI8827196.1 P-loop containing nucleoside triphosphate hydrolase protein [Fimicolochytrium jonesii]
MVPRQTFALFAKSTRVSIGASDQSSNSETTDPSHELVGSFEKLSLGKKITPKPIDPIPGLEKAYQGLMDVIMYPLLYPAMIEKLHVEPPKGVLLYGPPGVGKTFLVSNIARACGANLVIIHGPEIFGAYLGESEERLRSRFKEAQDLASPITPCILFIDEIDALTPRRESTRSQENRVVAQLLTLMDGMSSRGSLIVIGATNLPNSIDPALRRPGRFDREVAIDVPSEEARFTILTNLTRDMPLDADVDFRKLAAATNGYVGADLSALCREAAMEAVRQSSASHLTAVPYSAFVKALALMGGPSTQRGTSVSLEKLTWDDVGGLEPVKQKLRQSVEWPLMYRDTFRKLGLKPPKGVLLYGPPGCSKTTLVKIIAATSGATFLSLNGAALYSPYVGDSEQEIRTIFHRARAGAPSVVFFDEIDAIVGKRSLSSSSSNTKSDSVQDRVLSALLNEMDGVEAAKDVLVVGATNRPDMIDAALMRPGRFDRVVYVPPPDREARGKILRLYTKGMQVAADVDLDGMAERTERYTGADLKAVCREAAMEALRAHGTATSVVEQEHFDAALVVVKPTLSGDMLDQYTDFAKTFGAGT